MKEKITWISLSDVHLGHRRNKTIDIISNLNNFLKQPDTLKDVDILFIVGDLFDSSLDYHSQESTEITIWVASLLRLCANRKIKLRVLEGTPSHDWRQSKIFDTVYSVLNIDVDMRYIDTLSIEHIDDLDLDVLYVPDEWHPSTDTTFSQVQQLLKNAQIDKVDIAMMHGMFGYQAPSAMAKIPKHDEISYLNITRHYINIGHVHNFSVYDRIIAQGSFDRLAHGEEAPKGAIKCTIRENGNRDFFFISNNTAKIFKTVSLKRKDIDLSLSTVAKAIKGLPVDSQIRLRASKDHPLLANLDIVKLKHPEYTFTKLTIEEESENITNELIDIDEHDAYTPITITKENIISLLMDGIRAQHNLSDSQQTGLLKEIEGVY